MARMTKKKKNELKEKKLLELAEIVATLSKDEGLDPNGLAKEEVEEFAQRLELTPVQALLLAAFLDQSDDNSIAPRDLARHFGCRTLSVITHTEDIDVLVRRHAIMRRRSGPDNTSYRVPYSTILALKEGHMPEPPKNDGLNPFDWMQRLNDTLQSFDRNETDEDELRATITQLFEQNLHLHMVKAIKEKDLDYCDLMLYLIMSLRFINFDDDNICRSDFEDYFDCYALTRHSMQLQAGKHPLIEKGLIEHTCNNGHTDSTSWCLTQYSKTDVFGELGFKSSNKNDRTQLMRHEEIASKAMYYSPTVSHQVNQLQSLLEEDRMSRVLKRLEAKGLRKGFTCIFYGSPGTGKTETVMQLARKTGRDLMMVDVPSIRSKWVGETEKNIKALFDRYHQLVKNNDVMPILVFNEADALFNKRMEGCTGSVDKMENAMQNIILQEMENLEGILIATTNLTGSLDAAFERRFLYKIEFTKPTPHERCHIWQSMLTDLTDEQATALAERFDFSGGQIENIARKRIIADILNDRDTLDLDAVIESCKNELLNKKQAARIGFGLCG